MLCCAVQMNTSVVYMCQKHIDEAEAAAMARRKIELDQEVAALPCLTKPFALSHLPFTSDPVTHPSFVGRRGSNRVASRCGRTSSEHWVT